MKAIFAAAAVLAAMAGSARGDDNPRFFNPAQERRVQNIEARLAAVEALAASPQFAPAKPAAPAAGQCDCECKRTPTAPAAAAPAPVGTPSDPRMEWRSLPGIGFGWVEPGVTAATMAPALATTYAAPAFPTPVRSFFAPTYQFAPAGSPCAGGRCPR